MLKRRFVMVSVTLLLVLLGAQGFAQVKLAYVNSQAILALLPSAIEAQRTLEEESSKWGQELQQMNKELEEMQQTLEQQSLLLSDAKKQEKAEEMQALYLRSQQFQASKWGEGGEFFKRREELLQPVLDEVSEAIKKVGEREGFDMIFDSISGNLLHAKPEYDITEMILKELGVDPEKK